MNFKIRITLLVLSAFIFSVIVTACGTNAKDDYYTNLVTEHFVSTTATIVNTTNNTIEETTTTDEIPTSYITDSESEEFKEKQIVKAICMELYGHNVYYTEEQAEQDAYIMIDNVERLSENVLGSIDSEESAKEKGRAILLELKGSEFIDSLESDFIIENGEHIHFERDNPPYLVNYYEKYDVWRVVARLKSGKTEDGRYVCSTGTSPYVIIRGNDGKVLAAH